MGPGSPSLSFAFSLCLSSYIVGLSVSSPGPGPVSYIDIGPTLYIACCLDGSHLAACLPSCLWPCLLDGLWTHVVALSLVLSLALSPFAPDWILWRDAGPGSFLCLVWDSRWTLLPCPARVLWDWTLLGEGTACAGVSLSSRLPFPQGTGRPCSSLTLGEVIQSVKSTVFLEFIGLWNNPWKVLFKTMRIFAVCKISPSVSSLRFPSKCRRTLNALR